MKKVTKKRIYLDHAAITPVAPEVLAEVVRYSAAEYGNPSSIHAEGVAASQAIESIGGAGGVGMIGARKRIADLLHGHADEIIFTASGTEANNLAIAGVLEAIAQRKDTDKNQNLKDPLNSTRSEKFENLHMIVSAIEHPSVLEVARVYEQKGLQVSYLGVSQDGRVDPIELKKMIRPNTVLVSVMHVNNEIGTIQPIGEIAKVVRQARQSHQIQFPYLHVDASQSLEYLPIDLRSFGADLVTFDGQKMYGPRGIGVLWARRLGEVDKTASIQTKDQISSAAGGVAGKFSRLGGVVLEPIIRGGGQERGFRSGTENVAAICGLAKAFEIALDPKRQAKEASRIADLRDDLIAGLRQIFKENIFFNGSLVSSERIPNNVNISLPDRDTEFLLIQLDAQGISCSTKSSCLRDEDESYVIHALKDFEVGSKSDTTHDARASHSLRFSLGRSTTKKDINTTLKTLEQIIGNSL